MAAKLKLPAYRSGLFQEGSACRAWAQQGCGLQEHGWVDLCSKLEDLEISSSRQLCPEVALVPVSGRERPFYTPLGSCGALKGPASQQHYRPAP